ncbi:PREDICTED: uncharacterized protein LOC106117536 [Papilio xuthus]|uniref:Protein unc-93-like A n=1 Tax=Papilio xuthus TaxID=66420 RepID=A0A0N0P9I8_PAPXU|nr:PREDICTED: uncharacterized protein LOC106117536 [Papilio xuthus]KPJ01138.1 Protein unc-93-like A [Papilio xuthus]
MGSLPELAERARPATLRPAARTTSDPHRHRTLAGAGAPQLPVHTIYKKEWPWRRAKAPIRGLAPGGGGRRRDSAASSVGAASVRRLIARPPAPVPRSAVVRFTLLCVASGLCAAALLPFTAFAGAEAGAAPLAVMHAVAAVAAPLAPSLVQRAGPRLVVTAAHALVAALVGAHALALPLWALLSLYALCGAALSPSSLALSVSAAALSQAAGDESRRRVVLRRALRGLRAAQDLGLVVGALLLGGALALWPEEPTTVAFGDNITATRWPSPEDYYIEDDYEERTCGAAGCPQVRMILGGAGLSGAGRRALAACWAAIALAGAVLAAVGASTSAAPPDARAAIADPRAILAAPMGLFIGLQQGFIYTSYMRWYGVCVGGWGGAWRALGGAGALQALAAATLSMAAARAGSAGRALAAGGGAAHGSLLLALLRWRAARSDLALPAVAAAAWGACGALWDVLQCGLCVGGSGWRGPWALTLAARHAGLALACGARRVLCVRTQLAGLALTLIAALASHAALDLRQRRADARRT